MNHSGGTTSDSSRSYCSFTCNQIMPEPNGFIGMEIDVVLSEQFYRYLTD